MLLLCLDFCEAHRAHTEERFLAHTGTHTHTLEGRIGAGQWLGHACCSKHEPNLKAFFMGGWISTKRKDQPAALRPAVVSAVRLWWLHPLPPSDPHLPCCNSVAGCFVYCCVGGLLLFVCVCLCGLGFVCVRPVLCFLCAAALILILIWFGLHAFVICDLTAVFSFRVL